MLEGVRVTGLRAIAERGQQRNAQGGKGVDDGERGYAEEGT